MQTPEDKALLPADAIPPSLSLRQLWAIVWAYRRIIVGVTLGVAVLAVIASKLLPKTYEATATVFVDFEVNDPLSGRDFPSNLAASYMATQIDFVNSPMTLLPVVDRLDLTSDERFAAGYDGESAGGLREHAMARLAKQLEIGQPKDSRIIYIKFAANDGQTAARVANTVAEVYIDESTRRTLRPAQEQVERYAGELENMRRKVDEAQDRVTAFRQRTGLIDVQQRTDVETERLIELNRRLTEARARRLEAQQRAIRTGEGDAAVLGSGLVQSLKSQLTEKETELADASSRLGRRHPRYLALQAEIESLQSRLQREIDVYGSGARAEAAASRQVEQQLAAQVEAQRERVLESQRLQDEGARHLRELETASRLYEKALENYDRVSLGSRSGYRNASIVSPAMPPQRHSKPKTRVNLVLGFFAGAFLSVLGCLAYELMNRRLRCREDVERDLDLPVLGEISWR